ncbi:cysteine proteinase [Thozetella sp. PMI_491]|nr:cysteine proteinase [Thozetella sp. PMI_491]
MNSDARRILSHLNDRSGHHHPPPVAPGYYDATNLRDRITSDPSILIPVLVLAATVVYQAAAAQNHQLPPPSQLLWDAIVWLIPARLLFALDRWLNPPLFPLPPMLQQTQTITRSHAAKSEALRKLLGLDHGGSIMRSVSQAGRKGLKTLSGSTLGLKGSEHPPGLGNMDNSCYQNSILQGLASLHPLPTYLAGLSLDREGQTKGAARTTDKLRDLIEELNDTTNNGRTLWTPSVLKNMSTWQQQDAQEYYSKLLDEIDKEIAKAAKELQKPAGFESEACGATAKDDSTSSQHSDDSGYQSLSTTLSKAGSEAKLIRNPLEGLTAQRVACVSCGWSEGLTMIPFNCLTLSLAAQGQHDLYERLDSYTKVEFIDGVECGKCTLKKYQGLLGTIIERSQKAGHTEAEFPEPYARLRMINEAIEEDDFADETLKRCKIQNRVNSTKTTQTVVARSPQSLAIHINRSVFDENTGFMYKNFADVQFPMTLDLGPWCLGSAGAPAGPKVSPATVSSGATEEPSVAVPADGTPEDSGNELSDDEEQWLLDATRSMVAGDRQASKISGPIYELRAVVTHQGRHENGHYVCYRSHPRNRPSTKQDEGSSAAAEKSNPPPQLAAEVHDHVDDVDDTPERSTEADEAKPAATSGLSEDEVPAARWWRLSDQNVYQVDEETVLAQGGVFMLFYDCVDPNSVLCSEADSSTQEDSKAANEEIGPQQVTVSLEQAAQLITEGGNQEEATGPANTQAQQADAGEMDNASPQKEDKEASA